MSCSGTLGASGVIVTANHQDIVGKIAFRKIFFVKNQVKYLCTFRLSGFSVNSLQSCSFNLAAVEVDEQENILQSIGVGIESNDSDNVHITGCEFTRLRLGVQISNKVQYRRFWFA